MATASVGAPVKPGMSKMLERLGGEKANLLTSNAKMLDMVESFMGPANEGAAQRVRQDEFLLGQLTELPDFLHKAVEKYGWWSHEEANEKWQSFVEAVSTGRQIEFASNFGNNGLNNPASQVVDPNGGYGRFSFQSHRSRREEQYNVAQMILDGVRDNDPEFALAMAMSAILPIARQMIPNTVWTKAFITDSCVGEASMEYWLKNRDYAYMQGLGEEIQAVQVNPVKTYDPIIVTPREWKRPLNIELRWVELLKFDTAADILADGGRELQILIDQTAFKGLDNAVPSSNTNGGSFPAAGSTPNGFAIDSNNSCMLFEIGRQPQVDDLNFANAFLRARGYNPDLMILDPYELASLMSQQAVLMAYAYGTREVQETGLVGTLVGNAVAWCPNLYFNGSPSNKVVWVCDSDELARVVLGQPIGLWPNFQYRNIGYELYTRLTNFLRNANSCVKLCYDN